MQGIQDLLWQSDPSHDYTSVKGLLYYAQIPGFQAQFYVRLVFQQVAQKINVFRPIFVCYKIPVKNDSNEYLCCIKMVIAFYMEIRIQWIYIAKEVDESNYMRKGQEYGHWNETKECAADRNRKL